jgi:hypothetical protein
MQLTPHPFPLLKASPTTSLNFDNSEFADLGDRPKVASSSIISLIAASHTWLSDKMQPLDKAFRDWVSLTQSGEFYARMRWVGSTLKDNWPLRGTR